MHRLTREIRFSLEAQSSRGANTYAGLPGVAGFGPFVALRVTLTGPLDPVSGYLRNIVDIDQHVRATAVPLLVRAHHDRQPPAAALQHARAALAHAWPGCELAGLTLALSPYQTLSIQSEEPAMIRFSQLFEFSAAHRLHNPALSDEENVRTFGKCNNPLGHGHNYQVQVTLAGTPDASGQLVPLPEFESLVARHAIDPLDHKHLNLQVPAFAETNPSVENIARVIFGWLRTPFDRPHCRLAAVTVWETPKTFCEYTEDPPAGRAASASA
ncbi:MAG: 6-pyruvoyl trahydropterin synthase family protein [Tepidisphaeraceae bacterium]